MAIYNVHSLLKSFLLVMILNLSYQEPTDEEIALKAIPPGTQINFDYQKSFCPDGTDRST